MLWIVPALFAACAHTVIYLFIFDSGNGSKVRLQLTFAFTTIIGNLEVECESRGHLPDKDGLTKCRIRDLLS